MVRGQLGDPKLGVHNGLPVTVIVSTTLQELAAGAGRAMTGGGTLLPTRDLIRMASHAYHYLSVFDEHQSRPLYLGRARRIASADQRVVLYACAGQFVDVHTSREIPARLHPAILPGRIRTCSGLGFCLERITAACIGADSICSGDGSLRPHT